MKDQTIELPPLPEPDGFIQEIAPFAVMMTEAITLANAEKYARTAIEPYAKRIAELEADRKRRGEPVAIVDRTIPSCEVQYLPGVEPLPHGSLLFLAPQPAQNTEDYEI